MSVFQNSFDRFARLGGRFCPAAAGAMTGVAVGELISAGVTTAVEVLTPDDGFDPFAGVEASDWAGGPADEPFVAPTYDMPLNPVVDGSPIGLPFDSAVGPPIAGDFYGGGSSPADGWLNGHEFVGHTSSGTMDPSGEGNHVIMVDGHVLDLP